MTIEIDNLSLTDVITKLHNGSWKVPKFQREFVWKEHQIFEFVNSIFKARPIGMVTLWEQPDESELPLENISIPDKNGEFKYFGNNEKPPKKYHAILDGRQRCTALAMVFGGLSPDFGGMKWSGQYFLNVTTQDEIDRIVFKKKSDIKKEQLNILSVCYSRGLLPLKPQRENQKLNGWFLELIIGLNNCDNYPNGECPDKKELEKRSKMMEQHYKGMSATKLAITTVPEEYTLDTICDIFETLNQTGTKVSTVDLIHSRIYQSSNKNFDLREWIDELSQMNGTAGWASKYKRPELIAQFVTACYVALPENEREEPKVISGKKAHLSSVKSKDLLATPAFHWEAVKTNQEEFTEFFDHMQSCIAGGNFDMKDCPYPVSGAIYVALRWYRRFSSEAQKEKPWSIEHLNMLFKAFFWRNALTERYTQGFLTTMASDLVNLKKLLKERSNCDSDAQWAQRVNIKLNHFMKFNEIKKEDLINKLQDKNSGALNAAFRLPLIVKIKTDIMDGKMIQNNAKEFHHIYPRKWANSNRNGKLGQLLDNPENKEYVESVVNLIPLSKNSNLQWRDKIPGQALREKGVDFSQKEDLFQAAFIDEECFNILKSSPADPGAFWNKRAEKMAEYFLKLTQIEA